MGKDQGTEVMGLLVTEAQVKWLNSIIPSLELHNSIKQMSTFTNRAFGIEAELGLNHV